MNHLKTQSLPFHTISHLSKRVVRGVVCEAFDPGEGCFFPFRKAVALLTAIVSACINFYVLCGWCCHWFFICSVCFGGDFVDQTCGVCLSEPRCFFRGKIFHSADRKRTHESRVTFKKTFSSCQSKPLKNICWYSEKSLHLIFIVWLEVDVDSSEKGDFVALFLGSHFQSKGNFIRHLNNDLIQEDGRCRIHPKQPTQKASESINLPVLIEWVGDNRAISTAKKPSQENIKNRSRFTHNCLLIEHRAWLFAFKTIAQNSRKCQKDPRLIAFGREKFSGDFFTQKKRGTKKGRAAYARTKPLLAIVWKENCVELEIYYNGMSSSQFSHQTLFIVASFFVWRNRFFTQKLLINQEGTWIDARVGFFWYLLMWY